MSVVGRLDIVVRDEVGVVLSSVCMLTSHSRNFF